MLTTGCAWRHLPAEFGCRRRPRTGRLVAWTEAGLWRWLHRAVLDRLGEQATIDWSRAVVDAVSVQAKKGLADGPNPVDHGKPSSKLHVLTDAAGLPLAVAVRAANTHDSLAPIPLVQAIPAVCSGGVRSGAGRASCPPTRATTTRTCKPGCAGVPSPRGSPAAASRPAGGSATTAG